MPEIEDPVSEYSAFNVTASGSYSTSTTGSFLIFSTKQLQKMKDIWINASIRVNNAYARAYIYYADRSGNPGTDLNVTTLVDLLGSPTGSATWSGDLNQNNRLYNDAIAHPNRQYAVMSFGRAGATYYSGIVGYKS